ncbi:hypothetical protein DSO57_1010898 [Entomophthora muscae]|uniref:Uncharacterized protein n=1 Tax=Entomophthora muscae TaxID=34485 RepID=A0ACC2T6C0_9FUNG|nr:hypothetical protein DSO57_1010898 [Entomophthora muscae]
MGTHPDSVTKDNLPATLHTKASFPANYTSSNQDSSSTPTRHLKGDMDNQTFAKCKESLLDNSTTCNRCPAKNNPFRAFLPQESILAKPESIKDNENKKQLKGGGAAVPDLTGQPSIRKLKGGCSKAFSEGDTDLFCTNNHVGSQDCKWIKKHND